MTAPVNWERAEAIAVRVAERRPAAPLSISDDALAAMAALAEDRVAATTGLRSLSGPAQLQIVDRATWIRANIASFRTLLDPLMERWMPAGRRGAGPLSAITGRITAAEIGAMLGWMSGRVLGQYDLLLQQSSDAAGDAVYLVGPNIAALEQRFGFDPEQFRLWIALHELTHRAQFTGVSWMRDHFLALVERTLQLAEPDPARMLAAVRDAFRDRDAARQRLRDGGVVAVIASPEQQAAFNEVAGLMSLLEGHGDVVMDRAGRDLIPEAERFARVLRARRSQINPLARVVMRVSGLEGKLRQYAAGERFIAEIEAAGGPAIVDVCWQRPQNLPTLEEIRVPQRWLARVHAERSVA